MTFVGNNSYFKYMNPIIFIHPFKCAGTAISRLIPPPQHSKNPMYKGWHFSVYHYKRLGIDLKKYFVFTSTRNPWDRLVSMYTYGRNLVINASKKNKINSWNFIECDSTFKDWIHKIGNIKIKKINDGIGLNSIYGSMSLYGEILVDYIVNIHTIEEDIEVIKKISPIKFNNVPHVAPSKHDDYRSYYDYKEIEIVSKIYADDINYFGFCFEDKNKCNFSRIVNKSKIDNLFRKLL